MVPPLPGKPIIWIAGQSASAFMLGVEDGAAIAMGLFTAIRPKNFTAQNFERTPPRFAKALNSNPSWRIRGVGVLVDRGSNSIAFRFVFIGRGACLGSHIRRIIIPHTQPSGEK